MRNKKIKYRSFYNLFWIVFWILIIIIIFNGLMFFALKNQKLIVAKSLESAQQIPGKDTLESDLFLFEVNRIQQDNLRQIEEVKERQDVVLWTVRMSVIIVGIAGFFIQREIKLRTRDIAEQQAKSETKLFLKKKKGKIEKLIDSFNREVTEKQTMLKEHFELISNELELIGKKQNAYLLYSVGRHREAIEIFESIIQIDPKDERTILNLVEAMIVFQKDFAPAFNVLRMIDDIHEEYKIPYLIERLVLKELLGVKIEECEYMEIKDTLSNGLPFRWDFHILVKWIETNELELNRSHHKIGAFLLSLNLLNRK